MSRKKHKQKEPDKLAIKQEISIQDDPYWKVSNLHMDMQRLGRSMIRFEHIADEFPVWVEALLEGIPTWYCVLGVHRGATDDEIEDAYSKKLRLSYYTEFFIEEAYDVLTDEDLQKKYDELLSLFEQYSKCMSPSEKKELIENHNKNLNCEKEFVRMGEIQPIYTKFIDIWFLGAPGLYEIIGCKQDASIEDIKQKCENGCELFKKIYTILGDPKKREDFDFLMNFTGKFGSKENKEKRNRKITKWEKIDKNVFEHIIIMTLDPGDERQIFERVCEIMNANQDWIKYLPPNKDTFFSILGVDRNSLSGEKKDIEKILREKYRPLEKTSLVNLAYSMLKNESQRADYLWVFDKLPVFNAMKLISSDEEEEKEKSGIFAKPKKGKEKKKKARKKTKPQFNLDDLERMFDQMRKDMHL